MSVIGIVSTRVDCETCAFGANRRTLRTEWSSERARFPNCQSATKCTKWCFLGHEEREYVLLYLKDERLYTAGTLFMASERLKLRSFCTPLCL